MIYIAISRSPGQGCRHPLKARAPMEGIGMDAYTMAAKVGWDTYPVGSQTSPDKLPHGHRLVLVMIYQIPDYFGGGSLRTLFDLHFGHTRSLTTSLGASG